MGRQYLGGTTIPDSCRPPGAQVSLRDLALSEPVGVFSPSALHGAAVLRLPLSLKSCTPTLPPGALHRQA